MEPGQSWEDGFCDGLLKSRIFLPILSRGAINHPDKSWQNFSQLTADSNCDNVLLEHLLSLDPRFDRAHLSCNDRRFIYIISGW